jgi:hypothetical protein
VPRNLFQWGTDWLASQLEANGSESIVYRRGSDSVAIAAMLDFALLRITDHSGNTKVQRTDLDASFRADRLILSGVAVKPRAGDIVEVTFGDVTEQYEVAGLGNEPAWRYADPHKIRFRVHAKFTVTIVADAMQFVDGDVMEWVEGGVMEWVE